MIARQPVYDCAPLHVSSLISVVADVGQAVSGAAVSVIGGALGAVGIIHTSNSGEIHGDEDNAGSEETFALISLGGGKVAILADTGYFTADHNDRGRVWANRQVLGPWETWGLIHNSNGTVSFSNDQGWYMSANRMTDHCQVWTDKNQIGPWESFNLVARPNGYIALRAASCGDHGEFLSAAP